MIPSRTTVVLFTASLLALPVGVFFPAARWLVLGYAGCLFIVFVADTLLAARFSPLEVRRDRPARLSVGIDNEIILALENTGSRPVRVLMRDEPPEMFRAEPALLEATVPSHGWARLAYRLLPTERGNFAFNNIYLRVQGPLGLAWVDRTIAAADPVQVYPNLLEVRRYEALVRTTLVRAGGYRAKRLPGEPPQRIIAAADIPIPVQIVRTSGFTYCIAS